MTREEAIANLNMISVAFVCPVTKEQRKLIYDTFDMAIQALEQAPFENVISREWLYNFYQGLIHTPTGEDIQELEQEPKTGHWISEPNCWIRCSECGEHYPCVSIYETKGSNYCPNCGAKMEREV